MKKVKLNQKFKRKLKLIISNKDKVKNQTLKNHNKRQNTKNNLIRIQRFKKIMLKTRSKRNIRKNRRRKIKPQ